MASRKILQTYKRKHFSSHPDSPDVEKDNLLLESPSAVESSRDAETTKQASEASAERVEVSENLYRSSEDQIKSQFTCKISCTTEDISTKSKVDLICQRKAPMFTFIRRAKRKIDSTEHHSCLGMQDFDELPVEVKKAEICQENSTKKSYLLSDQDKRGKREIDATMKNSNLEVQEGDELLVEVNEPKICAENSSQQSNLLSDQHKRRSSNLEEQEGDKLPVEVKEPEICAEDSTRQSNLRSHQRKRRRKRIIDANLEVREGGKLSIEVSKAAMCAEDSTQRPILLSDQHKRNEEPSLAFASSVLADSQLTTKERVNCSSSDSVKNLSSIIFPEKQAIVVNEDHQVTSGRISDEDHVCVTNLLLLCQACDNIAEDASREKESHLESIKINIQQASDERETVRQMPRRFSLPDLNAQVTLPAEETCFQIREETRSQRIWSTPESTQPQREIGLLPSAPSAPNYINQQTHQAHDFPQRWKAYDMSNPPLYRHRRMLSNVLHSRKIFNRQKVDHLAIFRSQPDVWSEGELDSLWIGVRRHGPGNWARMLMDPYLTFGQRTPEDLAKRWNIEQLTFLNPALTSSMRFLEVDENPDCFRRNVNRLPSGDINFENIRSQSQPGELTTAYPLVTNGNLISGSSMYQNRGPSMSSKPANVTHWPREEASASDELTLACGTHVDQRVYSKFQREERFLELNLGLPEPMVSERMVAMNEDSSLETLSDDHDGWHQLLPKLTK